MYHPSVVETSLKALNDEPIALDAAGNYVEDAEGPFSRYKRFLSMRARQVSRFCGCFDGG